MRLGPIPTPSNISQKISLYFVQLGQIFVQQEENGVGAPSD